MLRDEQYHRIAETFGTGIGVAEWEGDIYAIEVERAGKVPEGIKVNILINWAIREGLYQPLQREVYRLGKKYGNRRIKESTIYEKAINNIILASNQCPMV